MVETLPNDLVIVAAETITNCCNFSYQWLIKQNKVRGKKKDEDYFTANSEFWWVKNNGDGDGNGNDNNDDDNNDIGSN